MPQSHLIIVVMDEDYDTTPIGGSLYSERWNRTVEWNSGMTTHTSRAMTTTRNDLYLSTEDRTVQRAFELVLARQVWDWSPAKSDLQASSFSSLDWPGVTWSLELKPYPPGDLTLVCYSSRVTTEKVNFHKNSYNLCGAQGFITVM